MKTSKKIISLAICASMILGLTACEQGGGLGEVTTTSNTLDDDINNPVDINNFVTEPEKTLDNPNLVYFGFYDIRTAGDIKPAVKLFEETYGGKIDYMTVPWGDRLDKLQTLVTTGQSPDLVDKENLTFPSLMQKNLYTDMTEYFEPYMSEPQWTEGIKGLVDKFAWKGKHYFYPFATNALANGLIYNADLFASYGLKNPRELYDNNQWDWIAFKNIMEEFTRVNPDAIGGVYGILGTEIFLSTGVPLIGIEADGTITKNFANPNIERAANFLMELRKENYAVRGDGMWSNETEPLASGNVAFLGVGDWKFSEFCNEEVYTDEFEFVPFPKDPLADKYYRSLTAFGYMVPSGSPNPQGAAAFINMVRKSLVDPELKAVVNESMMASKHYTREELDFILSFEDVTKYDVVVDGYYGFSDDLTKVIDDMLINIAFVQDENQKGWTQLRTENEGVIDSFLADFQ